MAKVVLGDGKEVARVWDGRGWCFDVREYNSTDAPVIRLRPNPHEAKQLAMLFEGDGIEENETKARR